MEGDPKNVRHMASTWQQPAAGGRSSGSTWKWSISNKSRETDFCQILSEQQVDDGLWTVWLGHDANRTKSCYHFTFYSRQSCFRS